MVRGQEKVMAKTGGWCPRASGAEGGITDGGHSRVRARVARTRHDQRSWRYQGSQDHGIVGGMPGVRAEPA